MGGLSGNRSQKPFKRCSRARGVCPGQAIVLTGSLPRSDRSRTDPTHRRPEHRPGPVTGRPTRLQRWATLRHRRVEDSCLCSGCGECSVGVGGDVVGRPDARAREHLKRESAALAAPDRLRPVSTQPVDPDDGRSQR